MTAGRSAAERLLIVDDDAASRLTLTVLLEDEGFVVEEAMSLSDASARISAGPPCAAVILDNQLGDGRGSQLVPRIRARWPEAKILSLSGDADVASQGSAFDGCVTKDGSFSVLLDALRALLATDRLLL